MNRIKDRPGRVTGWLLVVGIGIVLGVAGTITWQQPDRAFAWWESLRGMVDVEPPVKMSPLPSDLDPARDVQRRLRGQLADLEIQRQELEGRIRLLETRAPARVERGSSEDEESKRRSQRDAYAQQLVEIQSQIEAWQVMQQRVDRLVQVGQPPTRCGFAADSGEFAGTTRGT